MQLLGTDTLHSLAAVSQPSIQQHFVSTGLHTNSMASQFAVQPHQVVVDTSSPHHRTVFVQQPVLQQQALMQPVIQQQPTFSVTISAPQPMFTGNVLAGQQLLMDPSIALPGCQMPVVSTTTRSSPAEERSVFFAGVTPIIPSETLMALFSQFGPVQSINLFKPWAGSKTSKGCGIVVFIDRLSAAAAMEALNGNFQWPGARSPMVVEWMDANKQHKKARAQPLAYPLIQHTQQFRAFQPRPMIMQGMWNNAAGQQQLLV